MFKSHMLGTDKRKKCIFPIQIYKDIFKIVKKCSNTYGINFNHFFTIPLSYCELARGDCDILKAHLRSGDRNTLSYESNGIE